MPVFLHDQFGPGRHAKIVSTAAKDFQSQSQAFRSESPLTGRESRVQEVKDATFPKLLDPIDDAPPATTITYPPRGITAKRDGDRLIVRGTTTDNSTNN